MTLEQLTTFLAWCSAINLGLLLLTVGLLAIKPTRAAAVRGHVLLFGLPEADTLRVFLQYASVFKVAVIVFNVVPYLVLRLCMGG